MYLYESSRRDEEERKGDATESEQSALVELIKRSNSKELLCDYLNLKNEFYKQISSVSSIRRFIMGPSLEGVEFDRFLQLKHLESLDILFDKIPIKFVSRLSGELKLLRHFELRQTGHNFRIPTPKILTIRIEFEIRSPEENVEDGLEPDEAQTPYTLLFKPCEDRKPCVFRRCKTVNELDMEINKMKEDKMIRALFIK